jgi:hypothetical protein
MKAMEKLLLVLMVMAVANLIGKQEACGMCPGGVCTGSMHVTNTETTVRPDCTFPQPPKEGSKTAAKIWQWMQVQHR